MRDILQGFLTAELAVEGGVATVEPLLEEEDEKEDWRRGSSTAGGLAPAEAPELEEGRPIGHAFCYREDTREKGQEAPISEKAGGKHPLWSCPP